MTRHTRLELCLLLSVLVGAAALAEPPARTYLLEQKFTPGTYYLVMNMNMRQKQVAPPTPEGKQQPGRGMDMQQVFVMKMVVGEPDAEGNKTMTITYERIQQVMKMAGMVFMEFDSMAPRQTNTMMAQCYAPLLKAKITAVLDKQDNVASVSGFETIWDEMQTAVPATKALFENMKKSFNNESLKKMIQSGRENLPTKPVAVGETWTNEQTLPVPMVGKMTVKTTMTLASVEEKEGREIAMIVVSGTAKHSGGKESDAGPAPVSVSRMDIEQKGLMQFDVSAGQMTETNMQQTISMAMSVGKQMEERSEPVSMTMEMESDIMMKQYVNEVPPEMTPPPEATPATAPTTIPAKE